MIQEHPSQKTEYITTRELAEILNIDIKSIYNRLYKSKNPFPIRIYSVGGRIRFNKKDAERLKRD